MKRILTLEDKPVVGTLFRLVLKEYFVVETTTAEEAIQKFIEYNRRFELLIADVRLPRSSGVQVALILRSEVPTLKVMFTSDSAVDRWRENEPADLKRLGEHSLFIPQKHFRPETLLNSVRNLIGPGEGNEALENQSRATSQGYRTISSE